MSTSQYSLEDVDLSKLPLVSQLCVASLQDQVQFLNQIKDEWERWNSDKNAWQARRNVYDQKWAKIQADYTAGRINFTTKSLQEAQLNAEYSDVCCNDVGGAYGVRQPRSTFDLNVNCMNCQNTLNTIDFDRADVEVNQSINCILNEIQTHYPEALGLPGTGTTEPGTGTGTSGTGTDTITDTSTEVSQLTQVILIAGGLIIVLILLTLAGFLLSVLFA